MSSLARRLLETLRRHAYGVLRTESQVSPAVNNMIREVRVTKEELRDEAEQLAQSALGISAADAYTRLAAGDYEHTAFAARMDSIKWLLNEPYDDHASPLAAE